MLEKRILASAAVAQFFARACTAAALGRPGTKFLCHTLLRRGIDAASMAASLNEGLMGVHVQKAAFLVLGFLPRAFSQGVSTAGQWAESCAAPADNGLSLPGVRRRGRIAACRFRSLGGWGGKRAIKYKIFGDKLRFQSCLATPYFKL